MIANKNFMRRSYNAELRSLFHEMDTGKNGSISRAEFLNASKQPSFRSWLAALDLDGTDVDSLFNVLDMDDSGAITIDELLLGAPRIRGEAKSIDLMYAIAQVRKVDATVDRLWTACSAQ